MNQQDRRFYEEELHAIRVVAALASRQDIRIALEYQVSSRPGVSNHAAAMLRAAMTELPKKCQVQQDGSVLNPHGVLDVPGCFELVARELRESPFFGHLRNLATVDLASRIIKMAVVRVMDNTVPTSPPAPPQG